MKFLLVAAAALAGCSSLANTIGYSFDPQEFKEDLGNQSGTIPSVACKGVTPDPCAQVQSMLPMGATTACDTNANSCTASDEVRLSQMIDLSRAQTPLPSLVVTYGISAVTVDRVEYWVAQNSLDFATPAIDLYVAAAAAKDEKDTTARKLGTLASLPAKSMSCADPPDTTNDTRSSGAKICDLPLDSDGVSALQDFIKNYKQAPFQVIVHAVITATGGQPIPAGAIDLRVSPHATLSILK
jgi:hypothetical protein